MRSLLELLDQEHNERLTTIRHSARSAGEGYGDATDPGEWAIQLMDTWLLDEEQRQTLARNPANIFFLFAAAILSHVEGNPNDPEKNGPAFIKRYWKRLGIADAVQADLLAAICADIKNRHSAKRPNPGETSFSDEFPDIRHRLIVAAVRLAHLLDLNAPDSAERIRLLVSDADRASTDSTKQSYLVTGMGPHPYISGTIRVQIDCRHQGIHRALKHYENAVQEELHRLNRFAVPPFLFSAVIFEILPDGYQPLDFKFTIDSNAALHLFTGNRLYTDKRAYLRELIQNAVDACNLRKLMEDDYSPAISVLFNEDISQITIRDNGIGMSRQWIEKYFLKIGISFYQSDEIRNVDRSRRIDFNFISQFGIGFLSSFLVAERVVIRTRKAGQPGLRITITDLKDYFDVRSLDKDFHQGTEVTLHLKPSRINYCRSLEYTGYLKTNIRFLSIPVTLYNEYGETTAIGMEKLTYDHDKRWGTSFIAALELEASEGYLLLRATRQTDYIQSLGSAQGGLSIFQDGIFVTQVDTLLPEGARGNVVGRINLLGKERCELSMDRNRIFWTSDQQRRLKRLIIHGLVEAINQFMAALDSQKVPENIRRNIVLQFAAFLDFNDIDNAMHHRLHEAVRAIIDKRFRDFIRVHFAHALKTAGPAEADDYSEVWQKRIIEAFTARRNTKSDR